MPLSMYQASVPIFTQVLAALGNVMGKAEVYAAAKKFDPAVLIAARLAPDMLPLGRQVQLASDFAKGAAARLSGSDIPSWPDTEKTFAELQGRIKRTLDYIQAFKPEAIDGSEARDVAVKVAGRELTFKGQPYLLQFVMPNFYFHATTAYAILRHNGVELGKRDFMGNVPGLTI